MGPLEKLTALANRLIQDASATRSDPKGAIRLREAAAVIRGAVATIRTALEGNDRRPRHPKFETIVGDEAEPQ